MVARWLMAFSFVCSVNSIAHTGNRADKCLTPGPGAASQNPWDSADSGL